MKAMILAAGRGERLRPLTDHTPKPLIEVAGKALIEYHLENLREAGFREVIINTAWLATQFHRQLGDGSHYGLRIHYSDEGEALETAGGIRHALPLLGETPFLVVNGDIWSDYDFRRLPSPETAMLAHLVLVDNPDHHPQGDFGIEAGRLVNTAAHRLTFAGIGIYRPAFFHADAPEPAVMPLAPLIRHHADRRRISAEHYRGRWTDVGTPQRLRILEARLSPRDGQPRD